MKEQRLDQVLNEAESSDNSNCAACRIAAGLGITLNLCEEFKGQLDCRELEFMFDNPELFSMAEAQAAIEKMADNSWGKTKELLDYVVCLTKGECSLDDTTKPQEEVGFSSGASKLL